MQRVVDFAREQEVVVVHDFAYADVAFDGYRPPSILEAEGADGGRRRALHADQVVLDGRLARRLHASATREIVQALARAQVVPRLRDVPADPDRGDRRDERGAGVSARRSARSTAAGATRSATGWRASAGRSRSRAGRCSSGRRSRSSSSALGSLEFAIKLAREAHVAVSPGVGFGPGGDGFVRFALIENEERIRQGVRGIKKALFD